MSSIRSSVRPRFYPSIQSPSFHSSIYPPKFQFTHSPTLPSTHQYINLPIKKSRNPYIHASAHRSIQQFIFKSSILTLIFSLSWQIIDQFTHQSINFSTSLPSISSSFSTPFIQFPVRPVNHSPPLEPKSFHTPAHLPISPIIYPQFHLPVHSPDISVVVNFFLSHPTQYSLCPPTHSTGRCRQIFRAVAVKVHDADFLAVRLAFESSMRCFTSNEVKTCQVGLPVLPFFGYKVRHHLSFLCYYHLLDLCEVMIFIAVQAK